MWHYTRLFVWVSFVVVVVVFVFPNHDSCELTLIWLETLTPNNQYCWCVELKCDDITQGTYFHLMCQRHTKNNNNNNASIKSIGEIINWLSILCHIWLCAFCVDAMSFHIVTHLHDNSPITNRPKQETKDS